MTVGLANGMDIEICDIKSAYVSCRGVQKIYVDSLPPEFGALAGRGAYVKSNLYGLPTAGAVFAMDLQTKLLGAGFKQSTHDRSVYYRQSDTPEHGKHFCYICAYVDDLLIVSHDMTNLRNELKDLYTMKHFTSATCGLRYVGSDLIHDSKNKTVHIHAETYITEMLRHVERGADGEGRMNGLGKSFDLPSFPDREGNEGRTPSLHDDHAEELLGAEAEFLLEQDRETFASYIGCLNWTVTMCRLDIAQAVTALSQFLVAPRVGHARRVMRIMSYLKKYSDRGILLDGRDHIEPEGTVAMDETARDHLKLEYGDHAEPRDPKDPAARGVPLELTGYSDADHASNKADRRSTTGSLILLGRAILFWRSKRQIGCEGSSYASELRAAAWTARELRGLRMFLRGIGVELSGPSVLYMDNEATVYSSTSLATSLKVRHLSIDYHCCRELTAWGVITPTKVASAENWADPFTKATDKITFWYLTDKMMISARATAVATTSR
jgi:hypothetical protein